MWRPGAERMNLLGLIYLQKHAYPPVLPAPWSI
jgi:hypothetical protein